MQGTSLEVQWLRVHTFNAGGTGMIPDQGRSHMPRYMAEKRYMYSYVHSSTIYNRWNTIIILSHKKEQNNTTCINMMQLEIIILIN